MTKPMRKHLKGTRDNKALYLLMLQMLPRASPKPTSRPPEQSYPKITNMLKDPDCSMARQHELFSVFMPFSQCPVRLHCAG